MEDFGFDIDGILSEEEAEKFFEEQEAGGEKNDQPEEKQEDTQPAEEEVAETPSEKVGGEKTKVEENAISPSGDGSSPNLYSSIASALKNDGIFPDFTKEELDAVKSPDDFAELVEKAVQAKFDERTKRIDEALGNGVQPDTVKMYEQTLGYLNGIDEDAVSEEGEEGENLRRQLIFNDLVNRGYSQEKAQRELEKSFKSGSDVDDAKDALEALKKFYNDGYAKVRKDAKDQAEAMRASQKKQADDLRKMILDEDVKLGDTKLDKKTCNRVYDAISKPVYKDPETGRLMTALQQFQKEHPLEFIKQIGMWYVLTDGGKNMDGFTKPQVRAEKNKSIRELSRKINASSFNADGSLNYLGGAGMENGDDILLSDDWKIGQ